MAIDIKELKQYLIDDVYGKVRTEQRIDQTYYDDTFNVPQIRNPYRLSRTGWGRRLVDVPAEHITISNPQAYRPPHKETKGAEDAAINVSKMCNRWLTSLTSQNPNPYMETLKNMFLRGQTYLRLAHNESWVKAKKDKKGEGIKDKDGNLVFERKGLPVYFLIPDPMTIYATPTWDENGIPEEVIVWFERLPWEVKNKYPNWANPHQVGMSGQKKTVTWLEYWNKDKRHFEADGEVVFESPNPYGFVPFIHQLPGFGKTSPTGDLSELIVSVIKPYRNVLLRECAMTSDVDSTIHLFANRSVDFQITVAGVELPANFEEEYEEGPSMTHVIPYGVDMKRAVEMLPEQQIFEYLYSCRSELQQILPPVLGGTPAGSSGRQDEMAITSSRARYNSAVKAVERLFSVGFSKALEIIDKMPGLDPPEKKDINKFYEVQVELKEEDPLSADRKATLGSRLLQNEEIDPETNLIQFKGYTQAEARKILVKQLMWKVLLKSEDIAQLIGLRAAEQAGMLEEFIDLKTRRQPSESGLVEEPPASTKQRVQGEVQTPLGRETMDAVVGGYGQRNPPGRYTREG